MKTTLQHYGPVALLLAVILVASTLLSLFAGGVADDPRPRVLVTTYPLYVAAQNILGDTHGVRLELLSGGGAGCLHDYQLTPADRLALERADRVIAGIGWDDAPFLKGVDIGRLVFTANDVDLLCAHEGDGHDHDHGHVLTDTQAFNEHVWLSPTRYSQQTLAVMHTLIALDPPNTAQYQDNAANYMMGISTVAAQLPNLNNRPCVLFHDSLSYLAEDVGLDVKLTLSAEGESGLSAADLAQVEQLAKEHPDLILLYDTQYPLRYTAIDGLVPAGQVLALETAVVGEGNPSDWLDAMERNINKLQQLTEGGDAP